MKIIKGTYILHYSIVDKVCLNSHYVGFSLDVRKRINQHKKCKGSQSSQRVIKSGGKILIGLMLPLVNCEVQLQRLAHSDIKMLCRICNRKDFVTSNKQTKLYRDMKKGIFHGKQLV